MQLRGGRCKQRCAHVHGDLVGAIARQRRLKDQVEVGEIGSRGPDRICLRRRLRQRDGRLTRERVLETENRRSVDSGNYVVLFSRVVL